MATADTGTYWKLYCTTDTVKPSSIIVPSPAQGKKKLPHRVTETPSAEETIPVLNVSLNFLTQPTRLVIL